MSYAHILDALSAYLRHEKEEGRNQTALAPDTLAMLRDHATSAPVLPPPSRATPAPPPILVNAVLSPAMDDEMALIAARVATCTKCGLCEQRTNTVPGQGHRHPEIAFVGEGPGHDEDQQGLAFVGLAGQLLTKMIDAMGYTRDEVWIGNVVKCRPPDNRDPTQQEMDACLPFLKEQLTLLRPKVIVCLGATAVKALLGTRQGITQLRGKWHRFDGIDAHAYLSPRLSPES